MLLMYLEFRKETVNGASISMNTFRTKMKQRFCFIAVILLVCGCTREAHKKNGIIVREASGIARVENNLLLVGDDADGRYFIFPLENRNGPIIPISPETVEEVVLPHAELALDLEGIDRLADGRVVVLSEQLHCLIAEKTIGSNTYGVIAEYDRTVIEFGNRGLEGIGVKAMPNGASRIAVLWEGGYLLHTMMPVQLQEYVRRIPLKPVVIVHEIEQGQTVGIVDQPLRYIELNVPEPDGIPPLAQRFRATDLVWHRWREEDESGVLEEGLIVLLSSENSPPESTGVAIRYTTKILQRFNLEGNPVGDPLHINHLCKTCLHELIEDHSAGISPRMMAHLEEVAAILDQGNWENINWEGLDWFEPGESLITIYDKWPKDPPFALVIDIPEEWK